MAEQRLIDLVGDCDILLFCREIDFDGAGAPSSVVPAPRIDPVGVDEV
jgi:hypothetical protein